MALNVSKPTHLLQKQVYMNSYHPSCVDALDMDDWRLRTKGQPAIPKLPGK